MEGILVIDKPAGITSHDVVARVRRILKTRRVGHTGTLDPFATGVLVLLIGRATRLAQFLDRDRKEYEACIQFGFETDTGDLCGKRTSEPLSNERLNTILKNTDWEAVLTEFLGEIRQMPPMYSAKKVDGKKLYELARIGVEIERKAAIVSIYTLEIIDNKELDPPHFKVRIRVACSAGTYIRTLAEDIGRRLGAGAHLSELRRTHAGRFDLSSSLSLGDLEDLEDPSSVVMPMQLALEHLPVLEMSEDRVSKTRNGLSTRVAETTFSESEAVQMLAPDGTLIAIGYYDRLERAVQPKIVLM